MKETVLEKLKVLAESAKYDVSCASSGVTRKHRAGDGLILPVLHGVDHALNFRDTRVRVDGRGRHKGGKIILVVPIRHADAARRQLRRSAATHCCACAPVQSTAPLTTRCGRPCVSTSTVVGKTVMPQARVMSPRGSGRTVKLNPACCT